MSNLFRCLSASALVATAAASAAAAPPPPDKGAPPAPKSAPAHHGAHHGKKAKPEPPPPLPDPDVHLRLIAPSARGPWTMRIENDGAHPVRIPADARLLQLTIEPGDTTAKKAAKPVKCRVPASLRPDGFPEPRALLLAPGDAYVETFDPRLFCFGKDAAHLEGGVIVRAVYGWDAPKNAKKVEGPFAVEGTEIPNVVAPQKSLTAPTIVLGYVAPHPHGDAAGEPRPDDAADDKADDEHKDDKAKDDKKDDDKKDDDKGKDDKGKDEKKDDEKGPIVDEHAPRFEVKSSAFAEAATGFRLALTVTAQNTGHRAALVSLRSRNVAFRIDGPDGVQRCSATPPTHTVPRSGFRSVKPGGSTSITILVEEACGRALFRRPGLYRVTPSIDFVESGSEVGLAAYTGLARAKEPTIVRIAGGPEPFHRGPPKITHPEKPDPAPGGDPAP